MAAKFFIGLAARRSRPRVREGPRRRRCVAAAASAAAAPVPSVDHSPPDAGRARPQRPTVAVRCAQPGRRPGEAARPAAPRPRARRRTGWCSARTRPTSAPGGRSRDRHVAYYERRAAGGAGVVVTEEASVHASDWPYERCPLAADCGPGWAAVAAAVPAPRHARARRARPRRRPGLVGVHASARCGRRRGCPRSTPARCPRRWRPTTSRRSSTASPMRRRARRRRRAATASRSTPASTACVRQFLSGLTNQRGDEYGADRRASPARCSHAVRVAVGRPASSGCACRCDELAPWAGIVPEAAPSSPPQLAAVRSTTSSWCGGAIFSVAADPARRPRRAGVQPRPGPRQVRDAARRRRPGARWSPRARSSTSGQAEWAIDDGRCDARRDDPGPDRRRPSSWPRLAGGRRRSASGPASSATRRARCATPATRS